MDEVKVGRRFFLKSGGAAAAVAGAAVIPIQRAEAAAPEQSGATTLSYPRKSVARLDKLPVNQAVAFSYPDASSQCYAIRMGQAVSGGVGPDGDIVAYSGMCTHMGCPVTYDSGTKTFKCGCHFSMFDAENGGQMVCGQATEDLPRVRLEFDPKTQTLTAVGIDGLLYGRQSNIL